MALYVKKMLKTYSQLIWIRLIPLFYRQPNVRINALKFNCGVPLLTPEKQGRIEPI